MDPSNLPGVKGMQAMIYRALRPLGLWPPVIDEMELWQIGVLLDGDTGGPQIELSPMRPAGAPVAPASVPYQPPELLEVD